MTYPESFEGFGSYSKEEWADVKKFSYPPKKFDDHDVDIKIECCGLCGSDVHCAHGNWGEPYRPIVVGHEIIGTIVKVGPAVSDLKIGQRVGVGALSKSCKKCYRCKNGDEPYCRKAVPTYFGTYEDGYQSQGGYASHIRVDDYFVFPIPENVKSTDVAPFLCGGITVFSPMIRYGVGPGKKVGISGIGGIGHMGILLAKALGAEVYAISRNDKKKEDALKLGADHYIATDEEGWETKHYDALDVLVNCSSSITGIDFSKMSQLMKVKGTIISISAPPAGELITVRPTSLLGCVIGMTGVGSREEILHMLDVISKHNVKPWIETVPLGEEGIKTALTRANEGDVKYRFVFDKYDKAF